MWIIPAMRAVLIAASLFTLSGCELYRAAEPADIAQARYVSTQSPSVTLISMVNSRSGKSAHSALLINGSEQVLYDPAGTFQHPDLPRSGDVHFGVTPRFLDYYQRYHARFSHYVHSQKVDVSQETADAVLANAKSHGKSLKMLCAGSVTGALRGIEPFDHVSGTLFPEGIRRDFAEIPGVTDSYIREDDTGQNNAWENGSETAR